MLIFLKNRLKRIFPRLLYSGINHYCCYWTIGNHYAFKEYLSSSETYSYFKLLLIDSLGIDKWPGGFETNAYKCIVKGSLWTIKVEIVFYIGWLALGMVKKKVMLALFIFSFGAYLSPIRIGETYFEMFIFFSMGSLFYSIRSVISIKLEYAVGSLILIVLLSKIGYFVEGYAFLGIYLVIFLFNIKR